MIKTLCAISLNILSHILLLENFHGGSSYPSVQYQQFCICVCICISINILSHTLLLENFHGGSSYPSVQCQQFCIFGQILADAEHTLPVFCLTSISLNILSHILLLENFLGGVKLSICPMSTVLYFLVRSSLMLYTHCQWPYCIYSCKDKSVLYNMENSF